VSVDLSALELEQEEAARKESKKQILIDIGLKRANMHNHKSIVKGAPPSKRMIHYNALN
jgi:phospholipid-translocating ATPase